MTNNNDERAPARSWQIVDGVIPDDLMAIMENMTEQRNNVVYPEPMAPPWDLFPEPLTSMRWRREGEKITWLIIANGLLL